MTVPMNWNIVSGMEKQKSKADIRKLLKNKESGKVPTTKKEKAAVVNALLESHPTLSTSEIADITSINRRSVTDYLTGVIRDKEKSKAFNDLESIALDNACLKLLSTLDIEDYQKMTAASRIDAYCKLFDRRQVLAIRAGNGLMLSGVIEAIRKRKADRIKTTITVSMETDTPPTLQDSAGRGGGGVGVAETPINHENILFPLSSDVVIDSV